MESRIPLPTIASAALLIAMTSSRYCGGSALDNAAGGNNGPPAAS